MHFARPLITVSPKGYSFAVRYSCKLLASYFVYVDFLPRLVPSNAASLTVITASFWDGHPDHRTTYHAARSAAELVRIQRGIPVTTLHATVYLPRYYRAWLEKTEEAFWEEIL
jgi:hypothetical protein